MYDPDQQKTIEKLIGQFGEKECLRCGFLLKDDNETLYLTISGTGYLLEIEAAGVTTLHEAYAAGYQQGQMQARVGL